MSAKTRLETIVQTKLHRPRVTGNLVRRTRLHDRMNRGLERPLTLVCAPAGYGKSVLVSQWAGSISSTHAWLSLDPDHSELAVFLDYFVAAVEEAIPGACSRLRPLLSATQPPSVQVLSSTLLNDLQAIAEPLVIVLDDYHRLGRSKVHDVLSVVLEQLPDDVHLVLITRRDPPLPLASLRGLDRINDVRLRDLEFSVSETAAFLGQTCGLSVDDRVLAGLQKTMEGWAVGLRLVSLVLLDQTDPEQFLAGLTGSLRSIRDYLIEEVLAKQSATVRQSLLQIAILDRFCAELSQAVCAPDRESEITDTDGTALIHAVDRGGLFCIALDASGEWYRLHHLFRDVLSRRLEQEVPAESIAVLHARAGRWFEANGYVEEAIQHLIAAGDPMRAARLVTRHGAELMLREDCTSVEGWLRLLPSDVVDRDPGLLILTAWTHQIRLRLPEWATVLKQTAKRIREANLTPSETKVLRGCLDAISSSFYYYQSDLDKALACSSEAIESVPPELSRLRVHAALVRALTLQAIGRHREAVSSLLSILDDGEYGEAGLQGPLVGGLCTVCWLEASFGKMRRYAERLANVAARGESVQHRAWGCMYQAMPRYFTNDLGPVEELLEPWVEDPFSLHAVSYIDSAAVLALTHDALGRPEKATAVTDRIMDHGLELGNMAILRVGEALRAEIALRRGNEADTAEWARDFEVGPLKAQYGVYLPELTLARYLVQQHSHDAGQRAEVLLTRLEEFARSTHFRSVSIPVLALQALLLEQQGDETAAHAKLAQALAEAAPGRGFRFFLDLGPPIARLLRRLPKRECPGDFAEALLAAFAAVELPPPPLSDSIEPLTNRETEALELLEQRLRDKEIAEKLCVSTETVKYHLRHVYRKLGVGNRREAVAKARSLGLLPGR